MINDVFSIKEVSNGFVLLIYVDEKIEVVCQTYKEAIERLTTHLINAAKEGDK